MEMQANISDKIPNTTFNSSKNIFAEPVDHFKITRKKYELSDQGNQPSNNTQQRNCVYQLRKPTEKNDKQPYCRKKVLNKKDFIKEILKLDLQKRI